MREPHWHPETAEMGYIASGRGRITILNPGGRTETFEIVRGDTYFIPPAYPHHIENLGREELHILIFFDQPPRVMLDFKPFRAVIHGKCWRQLSLWATIRYQSFRC